ncbi:hypothetical protein MNBD_GAMMA12-2613 [hydrothermal vent metagenome]|uniref:Uncharacterized protein n=1 Tax=hydrothermal vent metagenome TaxID=652676 RepID=A0A3B0Y9W1_9ZZZZ
MSIDFEQYSKYPPKEALLKLITPFEELEECRAISLTLSKYVTSVFVDTDHLVVKFQSACGNEAFLYLYKAKEVTRNDVPNSYLRVLEHYSYGSFEGEDLELILNENFSSGAFCLDEGWNFENYASELVEYENKLDIVMDKLNSDHYILHPTIKNNNGERKVYYMGHDMGELLEVYPDVGVGGHFLRIITEYLSDDY